MEQLNYDIYLWNKLNTQLFRMNWSQKKSGSPIKMLQSVKDVTNSLMSYIDENITVEDVVIFIAKSN